MNVFSLNYVCTNFLCVKEPCYQTFAQLQKLGPLTAPYSILPGNQPNQESRLRENLSLPLAFPQWPDHVHWTHSTKITLWSAAAAYQVGSFTSYGVQLSRDLIRSNKFSHTTRDSDIALNKNIDVEEPEGSLCSPTLS